MFDTLITEHELRDLLPEFVELYRARPVKNNAGGMGFNQCFATFAIAQKIKPAVIIESGVWRGQSTWLFEQVCPNAELHCLDPRPDFREYTSPRAYYYSQDFALINWAEVDTTSALCFFDDHQSAYQRLIDMKWWGFSRAIFEDNYPIGEGDLYSLRQALADAGHPHIVMPNTLGSEQERALRATKEATLSEFYPRQSVIREPNVADRAALTRNVRVYQELPPVVRYPVTLWGHPWTGAYESVRPLFESFQDPSLPIPLQDFENEAPTEAFRYFYLCYAEMR